MLPFTSAPGCIETKIRLFGGKTPYDGRVEICVNDHWVSLCAENWDDRHAAVVCRQLGHNTSKFKHLVIWFISFIHIIIEQHRMQFICLVAV